MNHSVIFARMFEWILSGMLIHASAIWLRYLADRKNIVRESQKKMWLFGGIAWGNAAVVIMIGAMGETFRGHPEGSSLLYLWTEEILLSLLAGGLLAAACMDLESCSVYNYVWWWCLLWIVVLLWLPVGQDTIAGALWRIPGRLELGQAAAVLLYVGLQQSLFARMYGRADSHAFSVCALASCFWQGGMFWFLIHMLAAVILLAVTQAVKGNVTCYGRLRNPKPFIPYIVLTFWLEILCMFRIQ